MKKTALLLSTLVFPLAMGSLGCSSQPVLPSETEVEVSREAADRDCKEIGSVQGSTMTAQGSSKEALEDLQKEAARKGANYVVIGSYSANETSVSGIAYQCP